jgi:hypothetical protein
MGLMLAYVNGVLYARVGLFRFGSSLGSRRRARKASSI